MDLKTKLQHEEGKQEIKIYREFDISVELLYKAYTESEFLEQWMGTRVKKLECKNHGYYVFETTDPQGNIHRFSGTIHELIPLKKMTRTFEMENTSLPPQLEFIEFKSINENKSKLELHIIYKSIEIRDAVLKMPFAYGINMAHNKLETIFNK
jgi:uncharacterized protein YndB with AHSA1/START domain